MPFKFKFRTIVASFLRSQRSTIAFASAAGALYLLPLTQSSTVSVSTTGVLQRFHYTALCDSNTGEESTTKEVAAVPAASGDAGDSPLTPTATVTPTDDSPLPPTPTVTVGIDDDDEEEMDDETWEKSKSGCSFCKFFLESPCRVQFRNWSKCVDKCHKKDADFKVICTEYTQVGLCCFIKVLH